MTNKQQFLDKAFKIMSKQESIYQSSSFWEQACRDISDNIIKNDIDSFRSDINNLNFFVPTYGYPGNSFSKEVMKDLLNNLKDNNKNYLALKKYLNGEILARADYDLYVVANNIHDSLNISNFSESAYGEPAEHFNINNKLFSRSSLNYLLGLSFLKSEMPDFVPKSVLEIGGGFGTLGEIINQITSEEIKYIDVDLPPIFYIAHEYVKNACNLNQDKIKLSNLDESQKELLIDDLPQFTFLPSWEIKDLIGEIDLFVNFISFQEMEPEIVENYAFHIQRLEPEFLLLRNLREGKQKKANGKLGVKKPILKDDYFFFFDNYKLKASNTIPFGHKTVDGFHSELMILERK